MKIAVPTRDGVVDSHFGHCAYYTVFDTDPKTKQILSVSTLESPQGCGCKSGIADQMKQMGITLMLAGNIGQGAVNKLTSCDIAVVKGCSGDVTELVKAYLAGEVQDNPEICHHHDCGEDKSTELVFKIPNLN